MSLLNKLFGNQAIEREMMEMKLQHEKEMQRMKFEHEQEMMRLKKAQETKAKSTGHKYVSKSTTNKAKLELAKQVGDITDKQITFVRTMQVTLHKNHKNATFNCKTKRETSKWIDAHLTEFRRLEKH